MSYDYDKTSPNTSTYINQDILGQREMTIAFRAKPHSQITGHPASFTLRTSNSVYYRCGFHSNGQCFFDSRDGSATQLWTGASELYTVNEWNSYIASVDASGNMRLKLNDMTTATTTTSYDPSSSFNGFAIGKLHRASSLYYFDGYIAELGVWDRQWSADEELSFSQSADTDVCPAPSWNGAGLIAYWPLSGIHTDSLVDFYGQYELTAEGPGTYQAHIHPPPATADAPFALTAADGPDFSSHYYYQNMIAGIGR